MGLPPEKPLRLGFLLHDVSRLRTTYLDRILRSIGLTHSQCWVLFILSKYDRKGLIMAELSAAMDIGKSTLVGLVDRLESKGYASRKVDDVDRRIKFISLTDKGAEIVLKIQEIISATNAKILRDIPATDVAIGEEFLSKMKAQLIEMGATSK
jgi:DNA-binding MarR family transcriptional regulator